MKHYADDWLTVYLGDCREVMAQMEPESVHCVVTSPPYWGLRDYGTASWVGGDEACDHLKADAVLGGSSTLGIPADGGQRRIADGNATVVHKEVYRDTCRKCGATRQDRQLGLEPTPEDYVANMVAVFREVRRVLRSDGTVWLNLGDSYVADGRKGRAHMGKGKNSGYSTWMNRVSKRRPHDPVCKAYGVGLGGGIREGVYPCTCGAETSGLLKQKDLVGIPWRVAFALQADGWYLRSDIIWSKPNPMPESVTDRPTKSHEYLFLLSKSARYYYDADAVREQISESSGAARWRDWRQVRKDAGVVERIERGEPLGTQPQGIGGDNPAGRNLRSVWTIATQPYPGAHFATFPRALVEPCIKAATSEKGVCPECGAPWVRVREFTGEIYMTPDLYGRPRTRVVTEDDYKIDGDSKRRKSTATGEPNGLGTRVHRTTGWQPSCNHDSPAVPATVLDPFAGSGTTGMVAQSLSRRAVLIDLNADYLGQVMDRNRQPPLGLGAA